MKWFYLIILAFFVFSCSHPKPELSFYYWKAAPQASDGQEDIKIAKQLGVQHFYIHYMDVDWSPSLEMPVPRAWIESYDDKVCFLNHTFSPVIYITNNTFLKMDSVLCDTLAAKLARAINKTTVALIDAKEQSNLQNPYFNKRMLSMDKSNTDIDSNTSHLLTEIQIDCDWTAKTRDKYFYFLQKFRAQFPNKLISTTIRLYPYKYFKKMGVPPVDKGMLMCYNLGSIKELGTKNSILDIEELKQYLTHSDYPLPLDVALPVFGWYAWFRDNQFKGVVYGNEVHGIELYLDSSQENLYHINHDIEFNSHYFRKGDILRAEFPTEQQLLTSVQLLKEYIPNIKRVSFYHWDKDNLRTYASKIQKVHHSF